MDFRLAEDLEELAKNLIEGSAAPHQHLQKATIVYLWRDGEWRTSGRVVLGDAVKVSGREKFWAGESQGEDPDFVVIVNAEAWAHLDPAQRRAVLDHQLCHCAYDGNDDQGNPKWLKRPHDVEEFGAVVERNGGYTSSIRELVEKALNKGGQYQTRLDTSPEGEPNGDEDGEEDEEANESH